MSKIAEIWRQLGMIVRRGRLDQDLKEEMLLHAQMREREFVAQGLVEEEARYAARRRLGNLTGIREAVYEMNSIALLDTFQHDLRYALRALRKRPMYTFVIVLSLALSIGANSAVFSVVDALLFRPLQVPGGDQVIAVDTAASRLTQYGGSSYLDFADFRARSRSFEDLVIYQQNSMGMSVAGTAQENRATIAWAWWYRETFSLDLGSRRPWDAPSQRLRTACQERTRSQ